MTTQRLQKLFVLVCFAGFLTGAVAGTQSRWVGNMLVLDGSSGNNAIEFDVDGLRAKFGSGAEVFFAGNSTHMVLGTGSGAGYLASATPTTLDSVYVNNVIGVLKFGGGDLPARANTITGIKYAIRAAGITGSTDNVFTITGSGASVGTCTCSFACNSAAGNYRTACANGTGVGCVFAASTDLSYDFTAIGDCVTPTDILGNINIEGIWQ